MRNNSAKTCDIESQLALLEGRFNLRRSQPLPNSSIRHRHAEAGLTLVAVPRWEAIATTYLEAVEKLFRQMESDALHGRNLAFDVRRMRPAMLESTEEAFRELARIQRGDILFLFVRMMSTSYRTHERHIHSSPDFGMFELNTFAISSMLLTGTISRVVGGYPNFGGEYLVRCEGDAVVVDEGAAPGSMVYTPCFRCRGGRVLNYHADDLGSIGLPSLTILGKRQ